MVILRFSLASMGRTAWQPSWPPRQCGSASHWMLKPSPLQANRYLHSFRFCDFVLASAGFSVANTFADSEGLSDFLEQHAEALHIKQSNQQAIGNAGQLNTDAFEILDSGRQSPDTIASDAINSAPGQLSVHVCDRSTGL